VISVFFKIEKATCAALNVFTTVKPYCDLLSNCNAKIQKKDLNQNVKVLK